MQKKAELHTFKSGDLIRFTCFEQFTFKIKRDQEFLSDQIVPASAVVVKPFRRFRVTLPAPQEDIKFYYSKIHGKYVILSSGRPPIFSDGLIVILRGRDQK